MRTTKDKIKSLKEVVTITKKERHRGNIVVVTNGCFDIFHAGHVQSLEWAKKQGDLLIVAVNSDASVRQNKGNSRPIISAKDRALVLAGQESVDYVFIFSAKNPASSFQRIKPHIWVKGREALSHPDFSPIRDVLKSVDCNIRLCPIAPGKSTTNIIEAIIKCSRRNGKRRKNIKN